MEQKNLVRRKGQVMDMDQIRRINKTAEGKGIKWIEWVKENAIWVSPYPNRKERRDLAKLYRKFWLEYGQ